MKRYVFFVFLCCVLEAHACKFCVLESKESPSEIDKPNGLIAGPGLKTLLESKEVVQASCMNLSGNIFLDIPQETFALLGNCSVLRHLDMSLCALKARDLAHLFAGLKSTPIEVLDISCNLFSDVKGEIPLVPIQKFGPKKVVVNFAHFGAPLFLWLLSTLDPEKLESLDVSFSKLEKLSPEHLKSVSTFLKVAQLNIDFCEISSSSLEELKRVFPNTAWTQSKQ